MSGQTNGGVFNPKNLNMFGYTYNNPVNLVDPDGESTHVNEDGSVFKVNTQDNDLGIYQHVSKGHQGPPNKVGETRFMDSFQTLKEGAILKYVQHVDKIDHYKININFEPSVYRNPNSTIKFTTRNNQFITADLVAED